MSESTYARPISHVGLTVRDVQDALEWYGDVLGFEELSAPYTVERGDDEWGYVSTVLDLEFDRVTIAHMTTTNDVGFELFGFADSPEGPSSIRATGFNHVGVVDPNIEELAERIDREGGRHLSPIRERVEGGPRLTYCADPWDNRVEIYTQSHGRVLTALGRD